VEKEQENLKDIVMASQESLGAGEVFQEREEVNPNEKTGGGGSDILTVDGGNKTKARFYPVVAARKSSRVDNIIFNHGRYD
jgi:hypothetical protein